VRGKGTTEAKLRKWGALFFERWAVMGAKYIQNDVYNLMRRAKKEQVVKKLMMATAQTGIRHPKKDGNISHITQPLLAIAAGIVVWLLGRLHRLIGRCRLRLLLLLLLQCVSFSAFLATLGARTLPRLTRSLGLLVLRIILGIMRPSDGHRLLRLLLARLSLKGTETTCLRHLCLCLVCSERCAQRRILHPQTLNHLTAFFHSPVCFFSRGKRGVEQLRTGFEMFYVSITTFSECALRFPVLFGSFGSAESSATSAPLGGRSAMIVLSGIIWSRMA